MAFNINQLTDYVNLTRSYELQKGGWTSFVADLPEYPLYSGAMVPRTTLKASDPVVWTLQIARPSSFEVSGANHPVQFTNYEDTVRIQVNWAKVRTKVMWTKEEQELQGGTEEQLLSIVKKKKVTHDFEMVQGLEHKLAGDGTAGGAFTDVQGLDAWLPVSDYSTYATTPALQLNGGVDVQFSGLGTTVAATPRWGHARAGFDAVSDDDLFDKLDEFFVRRKVFVPEGTTQIDGGMPKNVIFVQNAVQRAWARLQTVSNDNLQDDLGRWRTNIFFMGIPVVYLPVISEGDSAETPADYGLIYCLDLTTWHFVVHSSFNFTLSPPTPDDNVPDTIKMWRTAYLQLICSNRERNLALTTTNTDLYG